MRVRIWGARGSLAEAAPGCSRYGGNTSCVEVTAMDGTRLVLDAGTGIRRLGASWEPGVRSVDLLLTHLHMDHVQGLGFFGPIFDPEVRLRVWGPPSTTMTLHARLTRYLSPPLFPLHLRDFACDLKFEDAPRDTFTIGGFTVRADLVCHPNPTLGFRIMDGGATLAYLPDHEVALGCPEFPAPPEWTSGYDLAQGADLLIHDTQYDDDEYGRHVGWGHSSVHHAVDFALHARARRLMTFHHDPGHDDVRLDGMVEDGRRRAGGRLDVVAGVEGASFDLG